jgi:hypothetical protein
MTRNLMVKLFGTLRATDSSTARRRPRAASPRLDNLENRLSLSSVGIRTAPADLLPQSWPRGVSNVKPMIQGGHFGTNIIAIL